MKIPLRCPECAAPVHTVPGGWDCTDCGVGARRSDDSTPGVEISNTPAEISNVSDGSTADYYELPPDATELQDLISYKNMNSQIGEITRSCYRYGESSHSDCLRDAKKIRFYINAEIERLEKYGG
jgi:hypothetical protein